MSKDKLGKGFPFEEVEFLPPQEVDRLSNATFAHMEATKPEVWFSFLYEQGLHSILTRFLDEGPFGQLSPTSLAMEKEIGKLNPSLSAWGVSQVFQAMQLKTPDELIAKYLDFNPPKSK
jgi:hypothetical protein